MKFSVIIPFYNVERYIEECVRSVADQDFPREEFEIICVDDCGKDDSAQIVERLTREFSNVKLIRHSENKRQGGGRNTGIREACGEWILFVDSDDRWTGDSVLSTFDNLIKNVGESISFFKSYSWETGRRFDHTGFHRGVELPEVEVVNGKDFVGDPRYSCNVWSGCYKRAFLLKENVFFREKATYEDTDWGLLAAVKANRIGLVDFPFNFYRYNPESVTIKPNLKIFKDNVRSAQVHYDLIRSARLEGKSREKGVERVKTSVLSFVRISRDYPLKESMEVFGMFRKSVLTESKTYPGITSKEKGILWMTRNCPWLMLATARWGVKGLRFLRKLKGE